MTQEPLIVTHGYKEEGRPWQFILKCKGWKDFCRETAPSKLSEAEAKVWIEQEIKASPHSSLIVGYQLERWGD